MRLEGQSTIAACERQLRRIYEHGPSEPLQLPTRARYTSIGGEAALAQLIVTWAQRQTAPHLQTYFGSREDTQIEEFVRRYYGLVAALSARTASGTAEAINVYQVLQSAALRRLEQLQGPNAAVATRGPAIDIVCADHLGKSAPYFLYQSGAKEGRKLRSRAEYRALAGWLIRRTLRDKSLSLRNVSADEAVGGLLYEVFRNTEDHALTDRNGDELNLSIRAVRTSYQSPNAEDLERMASDFEPLSRFCAALRPAVGAHQVHLLEISVLDSGIGFAESWTGKRLTDLSDAEEHRAVIQCFAEGSSKRHDRFGEGLPLVTELLLAKRGFLRLRTGRLSLYADFHDEREDGMPLPLRRWQHDDERPLARVSGTLITMLIPLRQQN